ncbi:sensor domain-containing diguanylate cyclase [Eubacteriaceae bacterium ES3]|nr:sensor domain-containing diguanylate cyclase [Eubacteriaceae bacterium ES3]
MNCEEFRRKKTWFCVISITIIAVLVVMAVYFLLPFFLPGMAEQGLFYAIGFIILFVPPLYFYIDRQLKNCEKEVVNVTRNSEAEKKSLSREMDERDERYRLLVENSPAGIITCDRDGEILMVNPAVVKLLGSPSVEATKAVNVFTFPPLVDSGIAASLKHCAETGEDFRGESIYTSKWGKDVYLRMHFVPLHNFTGEIVGVQGIVEDFTDYKKAQDQMRTYYHAIEHSPVAVLISDDKGEIEYVNPHYTKITGYTPADLIGQNIGVLYQESQMKHVYEDLHNTVTRGKIWKREQENFKKDGELYWEYISISPIFDENGEIFHYVSVKEDITKRREESEKAKYLAYHDTLTGLANRGLFNDRLMISVANAARYQTRLAIMYLDLDGFKEINDSYGHDMGDELLKAVSDELKSIMRKGDTVARMGGDEFTVIIPEFETVSDVEIVADKMLKAIQKPLTSEKLLVTISIGIAFYPEHGSNHEALLVSADKAMYQAKKMGKNNYRVYSEGEEE